MDYPIQNECLKYLGCSEVINIYKITRLSYNQSIISLGISRNQLKQRRIILEYTHL
jgi:hypothetical protein